ncbi:hypothetical protein E0485_12420 [Paenibacillus albiflavus]|uniref:Uncharacterized protein n=1 Tax=Paenibacillus albiflavus TaxID=2545760 RepID=A0A4R4EFC7_9BACL|nr:hypothetical protein [Paenibacillus albiflavus]TCZ76785.1 hypothetical protein E0485_12420 [Paenibacillus albiflavus]
MRQIAIVICSIAILLTGYKLYLVADKIHQYNQAAAYLENNDLLAAEESFTRTSQNHSIRYKEDETLASLNKLLPVTQMKELFSSLDAGVNENATKNNLQPLLDLKKRYEQAKEDYAKQEANIAQLFQTIDRRYAIDQTLHDAFIRIHKDMLQVADSSIHNGNFDQDSYLAEFHLLPTEVFGDEKKKNTDVQAFLKKYDTAKLNYWATKKSVPDYLIATAALWNSYQKEQLKVGWLTLLVEQHLQSQLEVLIDKDEPAALTSFIEYAKLSEANQQWIGAKSKLYSYITKQINAKFKEAGKLVQAKEFADAIALYNVLADYKDVKEQIEAAEMAWMKHDPSRLLAKALPDKFFSLAVGQQGNLSGSFEAAGINGDTLNYVRMSPDQKMEITEAKLNGLQVQDIAFAYEYSGQALPTLLLQGDSQQRKHRFILLELEGEQLNPILNIEADRIRLNRKGVILVDNAVGEGANEGAYYEYLNGSYVFTKLANDFVNIMLDDIDSYFDVKVRFQAEVVAVGENEAFIPFWNTYVHLKGNTEFKTGPQTIIGTWVGMEDMLIGNDLIKVYTVEVDESSDN